MSVLEKCGSRKIFAQSWNPGSFCGGSLSLIFRLFFVLEAGRFWSFSVEFCVQGLAKSRIYPWYKYELYSREVLLSYFDSSSCYLIMFQKCSNVVIISQMFLPSKRNWSTSFWDQDYIFALNKWCLKCDNWQVSMVTVKSQYKGLLYTCKKTQQNKRQGGYNCTTGVQG